VVAAAVLAGAGRVGRLLRRRRGSRQHGNGNDAGTGLSGIERRLAAFDGILALSSPVGGPTTVVIEVPCALSSPKISTS
jgi:hypothetical protein